VTISDRLIWTDIETTGLVPGTDVILEVGFVITDIDLTVVDDFQVPIWDDATYSVAYNNADEYVKNMHTVSGLHEECLENGLTFRQARERIADWLEGHGVGFFSLPDTQPQEPLCGSSVGFDRKFFDFYMPEVTGRFGYRNVDISSLKELCAALAPNTYEGVPVAVGAHRVLSDINDTIGEYEFYREEFLVVE